MFSVALERLKHHCSGLNDSFCLSNEMTLLGKKKPAPLGVCPEYWATLPFTLPHTVHGVPETLSYIAILSFCFWVINGLLSF